MTFEEIIQKVGRRIKKSIFYVNQNGDIIQLSDNNIKSAKPMFNAPLVGTTIKHCELILKEPIPVENAIYIEVTASYEDNSATKTYGPYYLKEEAKFNASEKDYTHECYDEMLFTMIKYEPLNISYPCTVQHFFDSLAEKLQFIHNVILVNGSKIMTYDVYKDLDLTYRDVLEDIAIANATSLGIYLREIISIPLGGMSQNHIKSGTVKSGTAKAFKGFQKSALIDDDILKNANIDFGEHFGPINSVIVKNDNEEAFYYKRDESLDKWNEFEINNNILMKGHEAEYLQTIYNVLYGIEFDLFDTKLVGFGGFEPLQRVIFETGGNAYNSYVFNWENDLSNGYEETIYTEQPEETVNDYTFSNSIDDKIKNVNIRVNEQEKKIEQSVKQDDIVAQLNLAIRDGQGVIEFIGNQFTVESDNLRILANGDIVLRSGAKITGADGMLTNLVYNGYTRGQFLTGMGDYIPLGRVGGGNTLETQKNDMVFAIDLPKKFKIINAYMYLSHAPIEWTGFNITGNSRNLKIYKADNVDNLTIKLDVSTGSYLTSGVNYQEIVGALGENGFTGSSFSTTYIKSTDLKDFINTNDEITYLTVKDSDSTLYSQNEDIFGRTGGVFGYIEIMGYTPFD